MVAVATVIADMAEELPGDAAADEGSGDEHGREHEGDRDGRGADLVHGHGAASFRLQAVGELALDVLDDDDRVVDDDADGKRNDSVSMLMEKPNPCITANVPTSDTRDRHESGMMVARHVCGKSSTTSTTSATASMIVT